MFKNPEEFVKLRESSDPEDCYRSAREAAPEEVWLEVIEKYPHMRKWVAHNKTVPLRILELLSKDEEADVRYQVAERRAAGEKILSRLAQDTDETVRMRVACNPKVTKEILTKLLKDEWERIREVAREKLLKFER